MDNYRDPINLTGSWVDKPSKTKYIQSWKIEQVVHRQFVRQKSASPTLFYLQTFQTKCRCTCRVTITLVSCQLNIYTNVIKQNRTVRPLLSSGMAKQYIAWICHSAKDTKWPKVCLPMLVFRLRLFPGVAAKFWCPAPPLSSLTSFPFLLVILLTSMFLFYLNFHKLWRTNVMSS